MYFAILGKNPDISRAELELVQPTNISSPKKGVLVFDTTQAEKLSTLGGIIKAGLVIKEKELPEILKEVKIIGIKEVANGKHLKETIGIRRFKTVDFFHTDREIKEKGKELINLGNGDYGVVERYQNIALYETIDFDKPGRSMQMGMMPAKLTHMMINIGLLERSKKNPSLSTLNSQQPKVSTVIYDPFTGSWTTGFLANAMGYDFIWSDIDISYAEKNIERWKKNTFYDNKHSFYLFQQDIFQERNHAQPEELFDGVLPQLIVTEWWLGPIITATSNAHDIANAQEEVMRLYEEFILQIHTLFFHHKEKPVIVFTIPVYKGENEVEKMLAETVRKLKVRNISSISEVYQRENQKIGRKIMIVQ